MATNPFKSIALLSVFPISSALLLLGILLVNPFRTPNKLQVLNSRTLPNGQIILLTQRYNARIGEPSTINIYQMLLSNQWQRYYLDAEASYWRNGKFEDIDGSSYWILRGEERVGKLDLRKSELSLTAHTQAVFRAYPIDRSPLENPLVIPQDITPP